MDSWLRTRTSLRYRLKPENLFTCSYFLMIFVPNSLNSKLPPATGITVLLLNEGKQDPGSRLHMYLYISPIDYKSL